MILLQMSWYIFLLKLTILIVQYKSLALYNQGMIENK